MIQLKFRLFLLKYYFLLISFLLGFLTLGFINGISSYGFVNNKFWPVLLFFFWFVSLIGCSFFQPFHMFLMVFCPYERHFFHLSLLIGVFIKNILLDHLGLHIKKKILQIKSLE
ncbi:hypothetical protein RhiirA4_426527 [Rhizophagus irregularis]|uniref:Uncharacterized protein n=1 Tax=Rhizophagus irregularis TaxID=588596 RepID=A0A2I1H5I4_9GLOM|nr:hypothetical protein RhiirA4_426527 [Rhizophagus irregularis]